MAEAAPIFDYTPGLPWVPTDNWDAVIANAESTGASAADALADEQVRALREDPTYRTRLRAAFEDAGLNLLSITLGSRSPELTYAEGVRRDIARWQAMFDAVDWLRKVPTPQTARSILEDDAVGVLLNTQNLGLVLEGELRELDALYDAGVRVAQLTYNRQNLIGTGCLDRSNGGLSTFGADVVARMNDLGMIVDCAHCNQATTLDTIDVSRAPVAATHVGCRALSAHVRTKTDEELAALATTDGYLGILAVPGFLAPDRPDASLETFFEHVAYAVSTVGDSNVGIGTDFANVDTSIPDAVAQELTNLALADQGEYMWDEEHRATELGTGWDELQTFSDWSVLADGIRTRFPDAASGILGENFLAFWDRVWRARG